MGSGHGALVLSERKSVSKSCRKACGIATLRAQPLQKLYWAQEVEGQFLLGARGELKLPLSPLLPAPCSPASSSLLPLLPLLPTPQFLKQLGYFI